MIGSKKGDPDADYLEAIELARLQKRACMPRPTMLLGSGRINASAPMNATFWKHLCTTPDLSPLRSSYPSYRFPFGGRICLVCLQLRCSIGDRFSGDFFK